MWIKHVDEIVDHLDTLLHLASLLECLYAAESASHDGNEQVHEDELQDQSWEEEEGPSVELLGLSKGVGIILTHSNQVDTDNWVREWVAKAISWDWILDIIQYSKLVKQVERNGKHADTDE